MPEWLWSVVACVLAGLWRADAVRWERRLDRERQRWEREREQLIQRAVPGYVPADPDLYQDADTRQRRVWEAERRALEERDAEAEEDD